MKKDRNTFFNEANFSQSSFIPTPNFGGNMNMPMPGYNQAQASQSFYSGPNPMYGQNMNMMNQDMASDFESRMAKLERQINRLDARISKLEAKGISTDTIDNTTNMYML